MVLLTMTSSIVEGLRRAHQETNLDHTENETSQNTQSEPSLDDPEIGKPISHGQIVNLWHRLQSSESPSPYTLEQLLSGAQIYIAPPPPKPEPTPEYKALMARLRREEEERSYERMINPNATRETFSERFPHSSTHAFASVNQPLSKDDMGDDEVTYNDVNRQLMLIFNFVVSILGVAGTLWMAARWWSLPARLFLTMGGSIIVAVAEVAVYSIYVWRMGDAKERQGAVKEVKEVVDTWVVGKEEDEKKLDDKVVLIQEKDKDTEGVRKRTTTQKDDT